MFLRWTVTPDNYRLSAIALMAGIMLFVLNNSTSRAEQSAPPLPNHFNILFEVKSSGAVVGELNMQLDRAGPDYALRSVATPKGLAVLFGDGSFSQQSVFGVKGGRVLPMRYNERRKKKGRPPEWTLNFDWDDMKVTMPDGSRIPIPRQPVDPAAVSIQMMLTPPSPDRDLVVHLVNDRGVRKHTFSLVGEELVETDMGTVNAFHLRQRKHGAKEHSYIDIWIAPENWNIPVKMQRHRKGRVVTFALKSLEAN